MNKYLVGLLFSGCIGPIAVPPGQARVSFGSHSTHSKPEALAHYSAGISLDSAVAKTSTNFDLQVGFSALQTINGKPEYQGWYGEFLLFTPTSLPGRVADSRLELGARGELLQDPFGRRAVGAFVRGGVEFFGGGMGSFSGPTQGGMGVGHLHGKAALGVHLEYGYLQGDETSTFLGTGLSVRLPAIAGVAFGIKP